MPYALTWFVVLMLLGLWSLSAWALHAASAWSIAHAGGLAGRTGEITAAGLPDWLAPWVPAELAQALTSLVSALAPAVDALLGWAPSLAGALSIVIWVAWGLGAVLLVGIGGFAHGLMAWLRRSTTAAQVGQVKTLAVRGR